MDENNPETKPSPSEIAKISIVFEKYKNKNIKDFLNGNKREYLKSSFLANYTFEDILNPEVVTDEQILIAAGLNVDTTKILYKYVNGQSTTRFGEITDNTEESLKSLNLLFFDISSNSKGLGQIVITQKEVDVSCSPSKQILDIFGSDITNDFVDILQNQSLYPDVNDWKYNTNTTITPTLPLDTLLLTYSDFLNLNANAVNEKLSGYKLANFKKDYSFFVNKYFSNIFNEWNIPSLYTTGLYACNNITYDASTGFTGSIGLNIYNKSSQNKKLKLPITNKEISLKSNDNVVILLELNNSKITPTLVKNTTLSNSANLVPSFSNVSIKYAINVAEQNDVVPTNWLATTFNDTNISWDESVSLDNANIFTNSLSLQCIVEKVSLDKNYADSLAIIEENKKSVKAESLRDLKLQQLTDSYNTVSTIVKSAESLMLKVANNPIVYDLFQNISSEMYNIINAITKNPNISNLVSQLFTTNKTSVYLLNNIESIINILNSLDNGSLPQLTEIIKLLTEIINNHNDPIKMHQWVASIEGLYPTLEKLLDQGARWILPMIGQIMTSLSQDTPIIEFAFNNIDYILTYLSQDSVTSNLGASTQKIIKAIHTYLNNLVQYSKTIHQNEPVVNARNTTIENTKLMQDKYKNIRALDVFTYELTNKNSANSILTLVSSILAPTNASTANILNFISNILANNVEVSQTIIDNTNATFENTIADTKPTTGLFSKNGTYSLDETTGYHVVSGSTTTTLSDQIGKCIKSLFNVTYGGKEMLLSNVLNAMGNSQSNIDMIVNNSFSYDANNYQVTQDLEVKYSFKQELKWNLLPISCFLDNLKVGISDTEFDSLITYITGLLPSEVSSLVTISKSNLRSWLYLFAGISFTDYTDSNGVAKLSLDLTRIFPTDLTIKPENNFVLQYKATNASIYPIITNNGTINWGYDAFENITFNDRSALDNANQEFALNHADEATVKVTYNNSFSATSSTYALNISYTNRDLKTEQLNLLKTQKYYGCQYSTFKKFLLDQIDIKQYSSNLPSALKIAISLLPANKINKPIIINPEPSTTNIASIFQSNTNSSIKDYNTNVYNPEYNVERIGQGDVELTTDLTNFVNSYLVWSNSTINANQQVLVMEDGASVALNDLIRKHYNIPSSVNFQVGISGQVTQLLNNTYKYNLYINFDRPVLYTYTDAAGVVTKSITQQISMSFTMSTPPTKPTPPTTNTPDNAPNNTPSTKTA
ncbi:MAG: hypothetical protein K2H80_01620 [Ureaplasma sp.]|nr:hypothetical protein [Ureaplasma sp.]